MNFAYNVRTKKYIFGGRKQPGYIGLGGGGGGGGGGGAKTEKILLQIIFIHYLKSLSLRKTFFQRVFKITFLVQHKMGHRSGMKDINKNEIFKKLFAKAHTFFNKQMKTN